MRLLEMIGGSFEVAVGVLGRGIREVGEACEFNWPVRPVSRRRGAAFIAVWRIAADVFRDQARERAAPSSTIGDLGGSHGELGGVPGTFGAGRGKEKRAVQRRSMGLS